MSLIDKYFYKLKCVKCGSRNNLEPYNFRSLLRRDLVGGPHNMSWVHTYKYIKLPVCPKCRSDFLTWNSYARFKNCFNLCMIMIIGILLITPIGYSIQFFGTQSDLKNFQFGLVIGPIIGVIVLIIVIIAISKGLKRIKIYPGHYVANSATQIFVKSFQSSTWIPLNDWIMKTLNETIIEENQNELYNNTKFLNSNSNLKKNVRYCSNCGSYINKISKI
ncbi:MAG: hypothetical protein P8Y97_11635 [Candidatus Lokiarchaeota archaeon]